MDQTTERRSGDRALIPPVTPLATGSEPGDVSSDGEVTDEPHLHEEGGKAE
jgi:hypothetical protein